MNLKKILESKFVETGPSFYI